MADDLNEFDDPEQSYRRGYVHGAREVLAAIERRLPADQRGMIERWPCPVGHHFLEQSWF